MKNYQETARMPNEMVSVLEVARDHGKRKQSIFKIIKKLRIDVHKEKSHASKGQAIAYISTSDRTRIDEYLANSGPATDGELLSIRPELNGFFYLIQLEPTHDPGRFKVGFATSIAERMTAHRTAAPLLKLIQTWPCKLLWEKTAIDCVTAGCERLHTEVYRTGSLEVIVDKCHKFFGLMPDL
jgi:hypothetical protein